ncbi:MAG: outer membrane protein assembly factor BamE [Pseudobdellovibrionaceae bacterium]
MKWFLLALFSLLLMTACAHDMAEQFSKVQPGMEKHDVLDLMNSPQRTQRWKGMDRWTYIYYDSGSRAEKEVHFSEGKAVYVGDVYKPEVSAVQQDEINEASNKEVESLAQTRREEAKKQYSDYETATSGQDGIRYVPQFTPVK